MSRRALPHGGFWFLRRNLHHSLKSPLCSCVSITLPAASPTATGTTRFVELTRHKISDRETCKALADNGRMANTQSTHVELSRGSRHRLAICSAFKGGKQEEAILAKIPAQAAWSEAWKSMEGIDPPRGFAFAWFKIGNGSIGVYSVHLKSNLVTHGDPVAETA